MSRKNRVTIEEEVELPADERGYSGEGRSITAEARRAQRATGLHFQPQQILIFDLILI